MNQPLRRVWPKLDLCSSPLTSKDVRCRRAVVCVCDVSSGEGKVGRVGGLGERGQGLPLVCVRPSQAEVSAPG